MGAHGVCAGRLPRPRRLDAARPRGRARRWPRVLDGAPRATRRRPTPRGARRRTRSRTRAPRVAAALGCRPREVVFTSRRDRGAPTWASAAPRAARAAVGRASWSRPSSTRPSPRRPTRSRREGFEVVRVPAGADGPRRRRRLRRGGAVGAGGRRREPDARQPRDGRASCRSPRSAARLRTRGIPLLVDAALGPGRLDVGAGRARGGPRSPSPATSSARPRGSACSACAGGRRSSRWRPAGCRRSACARAPRTSPAPRRSPPRSSARSRERAASGPARYDAARRRACSRASPRSRAGAGSAERRGRGSPASSTLELAGVEGEAVMINLDLEGIAVATGSTCALGGTDVSPVLLAMGLSRGARGVDDPHLVRRRQPRPEDARPRRRRRSRVCVARLRALARAEVARGSADAAACARRASGASRWTDRSPGRIAAPREDAVDARRSRSVVSARRSRARAGRDAAAGQTRDHGHEHQDRGRLATGRSRVEATDRGRLSGADALRAPPRGAAQAAHQAAVRDVVPAHARWCRWAGQRARDRRSRTASSRSGSSKNFRSLAQREPRPRRSSSAPVQVSFASRPRRSGSAAPAAPPERPRGPGERPAPAAAASPRRRSRRSRARAPRTCRCASTSTTRSRTSSSARRTSSPTRARRPWRTTPGRAYNPLFLHGSVGLGQDAPAPGHLPRVPATATRPSGSASSRARSSSTSSSSRSSAPTSSASARGSATSTCS